VIGRGERRRTIVKNLLSFAAAKEGERTRQPIGPSSTRPSPAAQPAMAHKVEAALEVEPGLPDVEVNATRSNRCS